MIIKFGEKFFTTSRFAEQPPATLEFSEQPLTAPRFAETAATPPQFSEVAIPAPWFVEVKGDGTTDDTAAINEAIRFASERNGIVFLPAGIYLVSAPAPDTGAIVLKDNVTLELAPGAIIQLAANNFDNYAIVDATGTTNTKITGGAIIGDRATHTGTTGEWGMGVNLIDATNCSIKGTTISNCWGDGIYIGSNSQTGYCQNISLEDVICDSNRRQGISIITVKGLRLKNVQGNNTNGTLPQSGLDLEPNFPGHFLQDIVIENYTSSNNAGYGIECWLGAYKGSLNPVSVTIIDHKDTGSASGTFNNIVRYMDAGYGITVISTSPPSGLNFYNLLANGNFVDTSYWDVISGIVSASNNTLSVTVAPDHAYSGIFQSRGQRLTEGTQIYFKLKILSTNPDCDLFYAEVRDGTYYGTRLPIYPDSGHPEENVWETISDKCVIPAGGIDLVSVLRSNYPDVATGVGKTMLYKEAMVVDLTPFGASVPSVGELDLAFRDWSVLKSTERVIPPTVTNFIINSTFVDTTNWSSDSDTLTASGNVLSVTGGGVGNSGIAFQTTGLSFAEGTHIYIRIEARVTNPDCLLLFGEFRDGTYYGKQLPAYPDSGNPVQNNWEVMSDICVVPAGGVANLVVSLRNQYIDALTATGKVMEVRKVVGIDLTPFGADIPILTECDGLFKNFV